MWKSSPEIERTVDALIKDSLHIGQLLAESYDSYRADHRQWCLNLTDALIQRHPDPGDGV